MFLKLDRSTRDAVLFLYYIDNILRLTVSSCFLQNNNKLAGNISTSIAAMITYYASAIDLWQPCMFTILEAILEKVLIFGVRKTF